MQSTVQNLPVSLAHAQEIAQFHPAEPAQWTIVGEQRVPAGEQQTINGGKATFYFSLVSLCRDEVFVEHRPIGLCLRFQTSVSDLHPIGVDVFPMHPEISRVKTSFGANATDVVALARVAGYPERQQTSPQDRVVHDFQGTLVSGGGTPPIPGPVQRLQHCLEIQQDGLLTVGDNVLLMKIASA